MRTPIIIAARNEADKIGHTLATLGKQHLGVEPLVVVNGSTDGTADIARGAGATVLESDEGKMLAIQAGLHHLGNRALDPLMILDADTRPMTKRWSKKMVAEMSESNDEQPKIIWGPYVFTDDINPALGAFITATSVHVSWSDRDAEKPRTIRGGNTGLHMKNGEVLDAMLELDNFWPREDVAIFDTMIEFGGTHQVVLNFNAWALTSGYRTTETIRRIIKDRKHPSKVMDSSYADDAPAGSKPYFSDTTDTVVHDKPEENIT